MWNIGVFIVYLDSICFDIEVAFVQRCDILSRMVWFCWRM